MLFFFCYSSIFRQCGPIMKDKNIVVISFLLFQHNSKVQINNLKLFSSKFMSFVSYIRTEKRHTTPRSFPLCDLGLWRLTYTCKITMMGSYLQGLLNLPCRRPYLGKLNVSQNSNSHNECMLFQLKGKHAIILSYLISLDLKEELIYNEINFKSAFNISKTKRFQTEFSI